MFWSKIKKKKKYILCYIKVGYKGGIRILHGHVFLMLYTLILRKSELKPSLVEGRHNSFDLEAYKASKTNRPDDRNVLF